MFYVGFTALLFSQNNTKDFYVTANTNVVGYANIYVQKTAKQPKKALATLYIKENTLFVGAKKLHNTRIVLIKDKKTYYKKKRTKNKAKTTTNTSKATVSKTHVRFNSRGKTPYSNTLGYTTSVFISLVTGQQKNNFRKKQFVALSYQTKVLQIEVLPLSTTKVAYAYKTNLTNSLCWLPTNYAIPPPQVSC
jgi:hypothetical protein